MDCVACGKGLAEAVYHEEDESQRYPLCIGCFESVDLRLLCMEREAQLGIDQFVESEIGL